MISHAKISRHRRMFKTLTGLSTEGFKQMLPSFEEAWEADLDRRDAGRFRLRGRGGGRKVAHRGRSERFLKRVEDVKLKYCQKNLRPH